jgi:hypothetical protein
MPTGSTAWRKDEGLDIEGLDIEGLDIEGLDIEGLDIEGLDIEGLDIEGLDIGQGGGLEVGDKDSVSLAKGTTGHLVVSSE